MGEFIARKKLEYALVKWGGIRLGQRDGTKLAIVDATNKERTKFRVRYLKGNGQPNKKATTVNGGKVVKWWSGYPTKKDIQKAKKSVQVRTEI